MMIGTKLKRMKTGMLATLLVAGLGAMSRPAQAQWAVIDGAAIAQDLEQFEATLAQWNVMLSTSHAALQAFRDAHAGLKDWSHLSWVDTLHILRLPWFDGVAGIAALRDAAAAKVMSPGQIDELWPNVDPDGWRANPRYGSDAWYRSQVDSLLRQIQRARATRAALLRQMQAHNLALAEDMAQIKALRDQIQDENQAPTGGDGTVDAAKIASLQGEIAALEAKHQGEGLQLANQRAIMFTVGQDDAQRVYLETKDRGWIDSNSQIMRSLGQAIGR